MSIWPLKSYRLLPVAILPLILTTASLMFGLAHVYENLQTIRNHKHVIKHIEQLYDLMLAVQLRRGLHNMAPARSPELMQRYQAVNDSINKLYSQFSGQEHFTEYVHIKDLGRIKARLDSLPPQLPVSPELFQSYTEIISDISLLLQDYVDNSKIFIDSEFSIHAITNTTMHFIPDLIESIGQIRGRISGLIRAGSFMEAQQLLQSDLGRFAVMRLHILQHHMASLRNTDAGIWSMVEEDYNVFSSASSDYLARLPAMIANEEADAAALALNVFALGTATIDTGSILHHKLVRIIEEHTARRAQFYRTMLVTTLTGFCVGLLLLYFLLYSFYRQIRVSVTELQNSETKTRNIINAAIDGIITIDERGIILDCNPATEKIFGYDYSEMLGKNVSILMPKDTRREHDSYISNYLHTGQAKIIGIGREVEGLRKNGTTFPMDLAVSKFTNAGKTMFTGVVRDITERKYVEKMKDEFVSTVSHELRTPLTSIRGALGLLSGKMSDQIPVSAQELVRIAQNNTTRLLLLINDILDIQKIESGEIPFTFHKTCINDLITTAIEDNAGLSQQYEVTFVQRNTSNKCHVYADSARIMQVLSNLMSNAAKFSSPGDTVDILLACHDDMVRVSVSDHGPGIPADFQSRIFEKFTQHDSTNTRRTGGTGLGLAISREIVLKHSGQISLWSRPGIGTTVYFALPQYRERPLPPTVPVAKVPGILIVEDDEDVAALLQRMFTESGYNADIAGSIDEARKRLFDSNEVYALATLDLLLPDGNGMDLLREIRAVDTTRNLPVFVISAEADENKRELDHSSLGVSQWISKPFHADSLLKLVHKTSGNIRKAAILHVEDDDDTFQVIAMMLGELADVQQAGSLVEARKMIRSKSYDLVILDIMLPDGSGLDFMREIEATTPAPPVIILSGKDINSAEAGNVESILLKSHVSNQQILSAIQSVLERRP